MASIVEKKNPKTGKRFYEIRVYRSEDGKTLTKRFTPPEGLSARNQIKEVNKFASQFELDVKNGSVKTKKEERAEKAQKEAEEAAVRTVYQYGESVFMPELRARSSANTIDNYQRTLNNFIYPAFGKLKMIDVTSADINKMLLNASSTKAHATAVKVYTVTQGLFKSAFMSDVIDRNPMDKVNRPKQAKDDKSKNPKEPETYTLDEVNHILKCIEAEPIKWQLYFYLLIDTGLRRSEALAIHWEDIDNWKNLDASSGAVNIHRSLTYTVETGIIETSTKNGKSHTVYLSPKTIDLLKQWKREQIISVDPNSPHYVFTQKIDSQEVMSPQTPTRYFAKIGKRYGISDLHPHKMRHTFASIAIVNGVDVASVSELLGHSDKAVTLRMYTHSDEESRKKASNAFHSLIYQNGTEQ